MNSSQRIVSGSPGGGRDLILAPGQALMTPPDRVDLSGSVSFFRKRLGLIVLITALALVLGAVFSLSTPATYVAQSTVTLEAPPETGAGPSTGASAPAPSSPFVDTQVEIIESREMARRVALALGELDGLTAVEQNEVIDSYQSSVSAERSGESYALAITVSAGEGNAAARAANEYARQFAQWEMLSTRERNEGTTKIVESRLAELRQQAQLDTAALQQYRIANGLLTTTGASLTEQEISSYNQEVTRARAEAAEAQARLNTALAQLRSGSTGEDVGEALGSSVIGGLRSRESQVGGEVANLESRYGQNHPQLIRARGELAEIRRQIQAEIGRIVSNLEAQRDVANQRLASLSDSLGSARSNLARNNAAMVGLDELERTAQVSQGLYETYLNSYKQLVAQEGTERPNARILTLANVPLLPDSPNIPLNMVLALVIGLGAGLAAAYVVEALFRGVTTADDVEHTLGYRFLGSIPLLRSVSKTARKEVPAITEEPRSAFAESFRSLRTSIDQSVHGPAQVIAITSALPKEGKTTTSACLAQTLAVAGQSTVLIDCDLRRRGISRLLRLDPDHPGLIEVLQGEATLADALVTGETGLSVLPIKPSDVELDSLTTGETFNRLIQELRIHFERIVLDLPPVLPIAAARSMAASADATVMVVRWRKTNEGAVRSALTLLPPERVNVVGVTISQVDVRRHRLFGQTDPNFFYRQYRNYYA